MARHERDRDVFQQPSAGVVTSDVPPPGFVGASKRTFFGHPVGLSTFVFTEMWERFSYYGIRPLLVLFMTAALVQGGCGFDRATASSIVGILYPEGGSRRDAGFSIFYMGINVGALVAPLITGVLGAKVGWHLGFGAAGVGMLIGLITYRLRADKTLGEIGVAPASTNPAEHRRVKMSALIGVAAIALLVV